MKGYKIVSLVLVLLLGCDKKLDVVPYTSIPIESGVKQTEVMLSGMYALIGSGNTVQNGSNLNDNGALYGNDLILIPDLLASPNYVSWLGTFNTYRDISQYKTGADNTVAFRVWRKAYKAINSANLILENLPVDGADYYKGQALFVRGIMHFELLRLFGEFNLGVPLKTKATNVFSEVVRVPRSSKNEVFDQVISDLETANRLISSSEDFYANKYAVSAFLARVYLEKGDYSKALIYADSTINFSGIGIATSVSNAFNGGSAESLFEIKQTVLNNAGTANDGLTTFYGCGGSGEIPGSAGRGDIRIDSLFLFKYDSLDTRRSDLIYKGSCTRNNLTSGKWKDPYANIPVIRISEMYLIRAECNLREGSSLGSTPLNDINLIRVNRNASPLSSVDLDGIFNERELELAFEGHRIYDLRRKDPTTYSGGKYVLPIPQIEINTSGIEQNSFYKQ